MANPIYDTLVARAPGGVLALPASTFGPGPFAEVISAACERQILRANDVEIAATDLGARLTGTGANAPFSGLELDATLAPVGSGVGMTLVASAPAAWNLADAWPVLTGSLAQALGLSGASLALGTGTPMAPKGLTLTAKAALGSMTPWAPLSWLFADLPSIALSGPIEVAAAIPVFSWSAAISTAVAVPGLGDIEPTLCLSCAAVANPVGPPYGPDLKMALQAVIPVGPGIPITIDVSNPNGIIPVEADPSAITTDVLATLGTFLGQELGGFMPHGAGFDPSNVVTLRRLGFMLSPARRRVSSAWLELGTPAQTHWPIADQIDVESIALEVVVPFAQAPRYGSPFVTALGRVTLPGGGLQISGSYSERFMLAAGLTDDSHVKLTDLLNLFLPTPLDADLVLDELEMTAVPGTGAWSLMADLTGDWGFDAGPVRVALSQAGLNLEHDPTATPATTGTIMAQAVIAGDITGQFTFTGSWTLPKTFVLTGTFPDIDLSALAAKLTGNGAPPGTPTIALTSTTATLELEPADETYAFSLRATACAGETPLGSAAFEVRKAPSGFGFLVGFDLPATWSPAELWSPLGFLFGALSFKDSGMVASTLPDTATALANLNMPSVPATVGPGITFFTTLEVAGGGLDYLAELLPGGTELDLLALIDTATPTNSTITAILTEPASRQALQIRDVKLSIQPASTKISAMIDAVLTVGSGSWAEAVTISGGGSLQIEPQPDIALWVDIENWSEPFGIPHLVVNDFGLRVNVISAGLDIGLAGEVTIGHGEDTFSLTLGLGFEDFEIPDWLVFELQPQPDRTLMLSGLIAAFVPSLDLSKVPVLNEIAFKRLEFYVIEDPAGITIGGHLYPQGIGLDCDVVLYTWELKLRVEVNASNGITAAGSVSHVIDVLGVLTISNVGGTTGPSVAIDTTTLMSNPGALGSPVRTQFAATAVLTAGPPTYLELDGKVALLGASDALHAKVTQSSFDFELEFEFLSEVSETIACSLLDDRHFHGTAAFGFDLDVTLGPWTWEGIELMPRVRIVGVRASAKIDITVDPSVIFDLGFRLNFSWGPIDVDVTPHLSAEALDHDLENLWAAVVAWMQSNLDEVFAGLVSDALLWARAIAAGLFELEASAWQVADALAGFFDSSLEDAASILNGLGFGFKEIVEALVRWFDVSAARAVAALGDAFAVCAMASADAGLGKPPADELRITALTSPFGHLDAALFELTRSPKGQRMLYHWYVHRDELQRLTGGLSPSTGHIARLIAPTGPHEEDGGRVELVAGVEILLAVRGDASRELREAIDEVLPELERGRGMTWEQLANELAR